MKGKGRLVDKRRRDFEGVLCLYRAEREVWRGEGDNDAYFTPARQPQ